jgi:CheY-like chemotaxis protein
MDILSRVLSDGASSALRQAVRTLKAAAPAPVAAPRPKEQQSDARTVERTKVLLAEDNVVNQLVVKNMIGEDLYDLVIAPNGAEAVELFLTLSPDVILMDLSMPVMDGLEATRRIRQIEAERGLRRTPIIAATAHVFDQDRERCQSAGMDDFLAKPVRKPKLEEILSRWAAEGAQRKERRSA